MRDGSANPLADSGAALSRAVRLSLACAVMSTTAWLLGGPATAQVEPPRPPLEERPDPDEGEQLFLRDCAVCHGFDGTGTARGPDITDDGTGGTHFMLTSGYMPIHDPDEPLRRKQPFYDEREIELLVDHVAGIVRSGPPVPDVEPDPAVIAEGGELFRLHCAACHQFLGTGGVLVGANEAPTLHHSTPVETVEAVRFGPGTMPMFSESEIDEDQAAAIATYVALGIRQPRDEGGISIGHFGPWSEGFVAWFGGLGAILLGCAWIGKRT